jgi:hypothetical protein
MLFWPTANVQALEVMLGLKVAGKGDFEGAAADAAAAAAAEEEEAQSRPQQPAAAAASRAAEPQQSGSSSKVSYHAAVSVWCLRHLVRQLPVVCFVGSVCITSTLQTSRYRYKQPHCVAYA